MMIGFGSHMLGCQILEVLGHSAWIPGAYKKTQLLNYCLHLWRYSIIYIIYEYNKLTVAFLSCLEDAILQIQCIYWVAFRLAKIVFLAQLCEHFQRNSGIATTAKWFLSTRKDEIEGCFFC